MKKTSFTPASYVNAHWIPEDAYEWEPISASSLEELEAKETEWKCRIAGKRPIIDAHYRETSLRQILPDRWGVAYQENGAQRILSGGEKESCYLKHKRSLYFKSFILGYGDRPIRRAAPTREIEKYVKEHCASSARLKAIALRAYESVANCSGYHTWTSRGQPIFLCLAAAKSSLDSMAAVLWALLFQETPQGKKVPSMHNLYSKLWPGYQTGQMNRLPFGDEFVKLYENRWFKRLKNARDKVVHQAGSPVVHDKLGVCFDFDLGIFKSIPLGIQVGKPRVKLEKNMERIHLDKIMNWFVAGLEKWEQSVARKLSKLACFKSVNTDGVLLGIDFEDGNLMSDGSGPSSMARSRPEGIQTKGLFVGLNPFRPGTRIGLSELLKGQKAP